MRVQVKTRERGLCGLCKYAIIVKGKNNESFMKCDQIYFGGSKPWEGDHVPFEVTECTAYARKGSMDMNTMASVAWILEIDKRTGVAGFIDNEEWNKKHPREHVLKNVDTGRY